MNELMERQPPCIEGEPWAEHPRQAHPGARREHGERQSVSREARSVVDGEVNQCRQREDGVQERAGERDRHQQGGCRGAHVTAGEAERDQGRDRPRPGPSVRSSEIEPCSGGGESAEPQSGRDHAEQRTLGLAPHREAHEPRDQERRGRCQQSQDPEVRAEDRHQRGGDEREPRHHRQRHVRERGRDVERLALGQSSGFVEPRAFAGIEWERMRDANGRQADEGQPGRGR